eukprot:TRINITY_DN3926_c0_g1_i2.p1 TRINITY_DN3926_c0_g1~~TRINITY_DN3926_c0_g1_i2.p1  ORF type:complete len:439 (+),score=47.29 TRINITY_DN3926_c0_g1_i2:335-1651(+)
MWQAQVDSVNARARAGPGAWISSSTSTLQSADLLSHLQRHADKVESVQRVRRSSSAVSVPAAGAAATASGSDAKRSDTGSLKPPSASEIRSCGVSAPSPSHRSEGLILRYAQGPPPPPRRKQSAEVNSERPAVAPTIDAARCAADRHPPASPVLASRPSIPPSPIASSPVPAAAVAAAARLVQPGLGSRRRSVSQPLHSTGPVSQLPGGAGLVWPKGADAAIQRSKSPSRRQRDLVSADMSMLLHGAQDHSGERVTLSRRPRQNPDRDAAGKMTMRSGSPRLGGKRSASVPRSVEKPKVCTPRPASVVRAQITDIGEREKPSRRVSKSGKCSPTRERKMYDPITHNSDVLAAARVRAAGDDSAVNRSRSAVRNTSSAEPVGVHELARGVRRVSNVHADPCDPVRRPWDRHDAEAPRGVKRGVCSPRRLGREAFSFEHD